MLNRSLVLLCVFVASPIISVHGQTIADVMKKLNEIDANVTGIGNRVTANEQRTSDLETRLNDLTERVRELSVTQRQLVTATPSGDVLDISSQMKNPSFRQAFDSAMHDVIRTKTGTFTITNKMPTYQRFLVNRVEYGLQPGEPITLKLPPGTVHVELPDEGAKTWMLGPPNYEQNIELVPARPRRTTYYPTTEYVNPIGSSTYSMSSGLITTYYHPSTYVERPVYVEPTYVAQPVYVEPTYVYRPLYVEQTYVARPVYVEPTYVARPIIAAPSVVVSPVACPVVIWR